MSFLQRRRGIKQSILSAKPSSIQESVKSITPLYEACRDGNEEQVRKLLPDYSHADLNRQEASTGNTCLHIATENGHDNIIKLLLKQGCYRSSILNSQNQSAYEIAAARKESTHSLFLRQDENDPSLKSSLRFYEQDPSQCFDFVQVDENRTDSDEKSINDRRRSTIQTYKTEEEKKHEIEYSASSKTMCQSRFCRFCVNHLHSDEPLNNQTILKRLTNILEQNVLNDSCDYVKAGELIKEYGKNYDSIEKLLHLYTLETQFYRILRQDSLPLAIPLFINLQKLKTRFFKGRVYRGMHLTHEQLSIYQMALETPGTLLETNSFSSTSMNRRIAEEFACLQTKKTENDLCVLFIFDFPNVCDQAINLSRISDDTPCLSEYEEEEEVLILPYTLFEVTRIRRPTDEDDLYTIYLINMLIPKKNLVSTFKWTWVELKNQLVRDKKLKFDCAFQKHKQ